VRPNLVAAALVMVAVAVASATGTTDAVADEVGDRPVFRYTDEAITESSGLVARDDVMFTVNDSGDGPLVYAVDTGTGDTIGVTTYSNAQVSDVEAIAPGRGGSLWVGDIGDNNADRPWVEVYRVPVRDPSGDREVAADRYRLVYANGARDAEALLVHPSTGRIYLVSKGILGGTVYEAPVRLEPGELNRMEPVGQVPGVVTDGTFLPGGRHLLLRTYGTGAVYSFPGLRQVHSFDLPAQEQGEAVAVDERGQVFIGTEGSHTEVLQIELPALRAQTGAQPGAQPGVPTSAPSSAPAPAAADDAADPASDRATGDGAGNGDGVWVAGAALLLVAGGVLLTASRRRSPRKQ
jgi:hypothetical protein